MADANRKFSGHPLVPREPPTRWTRTKIQNVRQRAAGQAPPRQRRSLPPPKSGKGMHVNPPLFFGSWEDYKKMMFKDVPLSNFDLTSWCRYLKIPVKRVFSRNEEKPLLHSPCIINLDDFGSMGTHWVCCGRRQTLKLKYMYMWSTRLKHCHRKKKYSYASHVTVD